MTIEVADRLCAYRKNAGLSQEELAEKIGVSRQAVSKWERAEASPDTDNLILLAKVYGVTLDELLGRDPEENTQGACAEGIYITDKRGGSVHIDGTGVHVKSHAGEQAHVGRDGVSIGENGHVFPRHSEKSEWEKRWSRFPWPVLCAAVYLLCGFLDFAGGWSYAWLVFLTIPLYYSLGEAIGKRNAEHFAYPVLVTIVYLILGFAAGWWHPAWVIFLTVPLYYGVCEWFKKRNK